MIFLINIQTLTTIGPVVSYLSNKTPDRRQTNRNRRAPLSYSRGHERSKKHKSRESADGLDYNTYRKNATTVQ